MKIRHKELENCRISPKAWVAMRQEQSLDGGGPRFSYNQALNYAISELYKSNSAEDALKRLDGYLTKFKNEKRIESVRGRLDEYATWWVKSKLVAIDSNVTIDYPFKADWHLGGVVSRVDLTPAGYRGILFETIVPQWKNQLRMPLLQLAIAERYGRPVSEVSVGFQDLDGNQVSDYRFGKAALQSSLSEFLEIGNKVSSLWPK